MVAVLPWALAGLLFGLEALLFSGPDGARFVFRILVLTPMAAIPLVAFGACLAVDGVLERRLSVSPGRQWVAGGFLALAASLALTVIALVLGGADGFILTAAWVIYSCYWGFAWLAGAWAWRPRTCLG